MNIREMRNKLGDTQSEFAARYHIPFRTVQNWETGQRKPPEYIMKLLESRIREDLVNRKTVALPKFDSRKSNLPKRSDAIASNPRRLSKDADCQNLSASLSTRGN